MMMVLARNFSRMTQMLVFEILSQFLVGMVFDDVDNIPGLADPKPDSASAAHDNGKLKY